jgi:hypothetical protein
LPATSNSQPETRFAHTSFRWHYSLVSLAQALGLCSAANLRQAHRHGPTWHAGEPVPRSQQTQRNLPDETAPSHPAAERQLANRALRLESITHGVGSSRPSTITEARSLERLTYMNSTSGQAPNEQPSVSTCHSLRTRTTRFASISGPRTLPLSKALQSQQKISDPKSKSSLVSSRVSSTAPRQVAAPSRQHSSQLSQSEIWRSTILATRHERRSLAAGTQPPQPRHLARQREPSPGRQHLRRGSQLAYRSDHGTPRRAPTAPGSAAALATAYYGHRQVAIPSRPERPHRIKAPRPTAKVRQQTR